MTKLLSETLTVKMLHLQGNTKWRIIIQKPMKYVHIISYLTYISKNMRKLHLVTTENYGMNQTFIKKHSTFSPKTWGLQSFNHDFFQGTGSSASDWPLVGPFTQFFHVTCGHLVVQPLPFQRGTCKPCTVSKACQQLFQRPHSTAVMIKIQQTSSKMEPYGRMPLWETVLNKLIQVWVLHLWKMLPMMLIHDCNNMLNFQLVTMHRACIWHWWHWSLSVVLALAFARGQNMVRRYLKIWGRHERRLFCKHFETKVPSRIDPQQWQFSTLLRRYANTTKQHVLLSSCNGPMRVH